MGKAVSIEISNGNGATIMKCPFCGTEMNPLAFETSHPLEKKRKWIINYDHPVTGKCKWDGFTNSEETWKERKAKS